MRILWTVALLMLVSRAPAQQPVDRELFNLFGPPTKPVLPKRPYQSYAQALEEVESKNLSGVIACKGVSSEILALRSKEAADLGWAFCEVYAEDGNSAMFETGTTKFKLVAAGKPVLAHTELWDSPKNTLNQRIQLMQTPFMTLPRCTGPNCPR